MSRTWRPLAARRAVGGIAAAVFALLLTACAGGAARDWHPVTTEESQVLAISRFQNFDAGTRSFETELTVQGQQLHLTGAYDFVQHTGYAAVTGAEFDPQALLWNETGVALRPQPTDPAGAPLAELPAPQEQGWSVRALAPEASTLDALLTALTLLGSDRPDNPLLVQQAGALWLGTAQQDDTTLHLYAGPPSDKPLSSTDPAPTPETATVRYAIDQHGLMHRVELRLGNEWISLELTDATSSAVPVALADALFTESTH